MERQATDFGRIRRLLLWLNLIIMLFPPIHLAMARGNIGLAMLFFMGSGLFLVVSLTYLHRASPDREEE